MRLSIKKLSLLSLLSLIALNAPADSRNLGGQINAIKYDSKISPELLLIANRLSFQQKARNVNTVSQSQAMEFVTINATANESAESLLRDMTALGMKYGQTAGIVVSGLLPVSSIDRVSQLKSLRHLTREHTFVRTGSVVSQGVSATGADIVKSKFGLDGEGITVGFISDSYDCFAQSDDAGKLARTAAVDKASGDLPVDAYALEDAYLCEFKTDEGRALMQVVHDFAPRAKLVFLAGGNGLASTVNGIFRLANEIGVNIIVDDTASRIETFFQDGPVTDAINQVSKQGVTYVTSVGNSGRNSYQSKYREAINTVLDVNAHDFDAGDGVDVFQEFSLDAGSSIEISLQWDEPAYSVSGFPGAQTDLDLFIVNADESEIIQAANFINISNDPSEFISFYNPESSSSTKFNILISKAAGESPGLLKYVIEGRFEGKIEEYQTNSGTTVGRANASSAISVGAARYDQTPSYGQSPPVLQFFSSAGGDTPILFDVFGKAMNEPVFRQKPEIVGPDGVNTTFFNFCDDELCQENPDTDNDSLPNFVGTSASAPHVAGIVALLLQLNGDLQPADIKQIIQQSAIDILLRNNQNPSEDIIDISQNLGVDNDSGYGLIDAVAAIRLAESYAPSVQAPVNESVTMTNKVDAVSVGGAMDALIVLLLSVSSLRFRFERSLRKFF